MNQSYTNRSNLKDKSPRCPRRNWFSGDPGNISTKKTERLVLVMSTSTLTEKQIGEISLLILQLKMRRRGLELKPDEFTLGAAREARTIGCTSEELLDFGQKHILPHVLSACGMKVATNDLSLTLTGREAEIACKLLEEEFFWNLKGLRQEIQQLWSKIPHDKFKLDDLTAVVKNIVYGHICDQFGSAENDLTVKIEGLPMPRQT